MPTKEQIEAIVKILQPILRISDWDIDVELLHESEYEKLIDSDTQAHNHIERMLNSSFITINIESSDDWYISLLHELVHLVFDPIEQAGTNACNLTNGRISKCIDDEYTVAMERTVDRMAKIISKLYPVTNFKDILED